VLHQLAAGRRDVLAEVLQNLESEELLVVERAFELVALGVQRANPAVAAALAACAPNATHTDAPVVHAAVAPRGAVAANEGPAANTLPAANVS
jgi:hypothetical protein